MSSSVMLHGDVQFKGLQSGVVNFQLLASVPHGSHLFVSCHLGFS